MASRAGFRQTDHGEWERDSQWKVEEIDLRLREVSLRGLQPALRVAIPRSEPSPLGDSIAIWLRANFPVFLIQTHQ